VFYINNRFGVKDVFQNFLGVEKLRIPGEVQHGYWSEGKWVGYIENRMRFTPMFLWGGELEKALSHRTSGRIKYIGDPWFYMTIDPLLRQSTIELKTRLIPSFKKWMTREERVEKHKNFIRDCRSILDVEGLVSLHPAEPKTKEVKRLYEQNGFLMEDTISISDPEFLPKKARSYLESQMIFTDYVGPHLFRASTLDVQVVLLRTDDFKLDVEHREILEIFGTAKIGASGILERKNLSLFKLGFENVRSRTELAKLFHASSVYQNSLEILYHSKELPLRVRNLATSKSNMSRVENFNSDSQCPHCYGQIKKNRSGIGICRYCWARFNI
jgi:hypothetical protein